MANCISQTSLSNWTYINSGFLWALWPPINLLYHAVSQLWQIPSSSRQGELNRKHWTLETAFRLIEKPSEREKKQARTPSCSSPQGWGQGKQHLASRSLCYLHGNRPVSGPVRNRITLAGRLLWISAKFGSNQSWFQPRLWNLLQVMQFISHEYPSPWKDGNTNQPGFSQMKYPTLDKSYIT